MPDGVIGEGTGANALVARHAKILEGEHTVAKPQIGAGAIHPDAAEARPAERERAVALPGGRVATRAAETEVNVRRTLPAPLAQERPEPLRQKKLAGTRDERAVEIQTEIVRRVEQVGVELPAAMPQADVAQHGACAVPGEIASRPLEVDLMVGKFFDRKFADHFEFFFGCANRGGAGGLELRWRLESDTVQHRAEAEAA